MTYVLKFHNITLTGVDFQQYNIDISHKSMTSIRVSAGYSWMVNYSYAWERLIKSHQSSKEIIILFLFNSRAIDKIWVCSCALVKA